VILAYDLCCFEGCGECADAVRLEGFGCGLRDWFRAERVREFLPIGICRQRIVRAFFGFYHGQYFCARGDRRIGIGVDVVRGSEAQRFALPGFDSGQIVGAALHGS